MAERMSPITLATSAAVSAKRLVKLSTGTAIHNTATATDDPVGVACYAAASGDDVAIRLLTEPGTFEMVAAGAISLGADVYAAADGEIQAVPTAAGTYRKIGIAMEAATADGDFIEVLPYDQYATTTVTE